MIQNYTTIAGMSFFSLKYHNKPHSQRTTLRDSHQWELSSLTRYFEYVMEY